METLGQLISNARRRTPSLTQEQLANQVSKSKQWIGSIEKGAAVPTLELLLQLHRELIADDASDPDSDLKIWLLKWLEASINQEPAIDKEKALTAIKQLHGHSKQARKTRLSSSNLPTLEDFPEGFENLVIVCGDRRETPPKTKADLFVDSFSTADLISLTTLFDKTGPLEIRSDKTCVLGDRDYLKREYGRKNIIVLGSPAVNLLARSINEQCVFRFSILKAARDFLNDLEDRVPEIKDPVLRIIFWEMASRWREPPDDDNIDTARYYEDYKMRGFRIHEAQIVDLAPKVRELLKDHTAKEMKNFFRSRGFDDPVDARWQGHFTRQDNDFGVISLCPNPYSEDDNYLCILVGGIHAPGTDMAVRILANDGFKGYPLGGVIEVKLDLESSWIERFPRATFGWQTRPYSFDNILEKLNNREAYSMFDEWEQDEIDKLIAFVKRFTEEPAISAE